MKTILVTFVLVAVVSAEFPSFVNICNRDSQLNDCLKNNMNRAREYLKHGLPSLFLPKSDKIVIETDTVIPLKTMNGTHRQGFIYSYLDSYVVKNVNLDLDNDIISIDWVWRRIQGNGNYKLEGKLLGLDVNGGGKCVVDLVNMGISLTMSGERKQNEDKNYIIFNNGDLKLKLDQLRGFVYFGKLFSSAEKTSSVNRKLNSNIRTTIELFEPVVKNILVAPFVNSIQKMFQTYPIEVLFPL